MSDISRVIAMINRLEEDGIIERYAIGGAVGATFHIESGALKMESFRSILARHGLSDRWREFERTFLTDAQ